jgi:hypothetical protein
MIGATADAIDKAEDRELFREAMTKIGLERRARMHAKTLTEALPALDIIGLPRSSGRPSPWAAPAAASPTTRRVHRDRRARASTPRRPARS